MCIRIDSLAKQNVSRVSHGKPYPRDTRETQLSPSCPDSSHSSMCKSHESLRGMLSRKIPTKILQSSIAWVFTHSLFITQPLQSNSTINTGYKRLNRITIKFGTELKPTKYIVVNHNFTAIILLLLPQPIRWLWRMIVIVRILLMMKYQRSWPFKKPMISYALNT